MKGSREGVTDFPFPIPIRNVHEARPALALQSHYFSVRIVGSYCGLGEDRLLEDTPQVSTDAQPAVEKSMDNTLVRVAI